MDLIEVRQLGRISDNIRFNSPDDVIEYCHKKPLEMCTLAQEVLYCFCINTKNQINSVELISKGSLTGSIVHPREVLKAAILTNSASIILAHNHPSGNPEPSEDDIEITKRIARACEIMGISFLDHVIISENSDYSMKRNDMF